MKLHQIPRSLAPFAVIFLLFLPGLVFSFISSLEYQIQWGVFGTGNGEFDLPTCIVVGTDGNLYVTDRNNGRVQKFDPDGNFILEWDGSGGNRLTNPVGIGVDDMTGDIYVTDVGDHNIRKFTNTGSFITAWGDSGDTLTKFNKPAGIDVDGFGDVYVADSKNHRIQKFTSAGAFVTAWGDSGDSTGQFIEPLGVLAHNDAIYIADSRNNRIQKFDLFGNFIMTWGETGTGDGQFLRTFAIAVDSAGVLYVSDADGNRVQRFDATGVFLDKFGEPGFGSGQFITPTGIAVNDSCQVYVTDRNNNRIQRFGVPTGEPAPDLLLSWGQNGADPGEFFSPIGIDVEPWFVYVADLDNHRIQKFDSHGSFLMEWGSQGIGDGQFIQVTGVAVDGNGYVFVSDNANNRIQKFTTSGVFVTAWGDTGNGAGEFMFPRGLAVNSVGHLYVSDGTNHRVQKFDNNGVFLLEWGQDGGNDGEFAFTKGITVDLNDDVYVADSDNHRVQKFDSNGEFILKWGTEGSADGQFLNPRDVAVDDAGNVYVTDYFNHRVQVFDTLGNFIAKWGSGPSTQSGRFDKPYAVAVDNCGRIFISEFGNHRIQQFGDPTDCGPNTPVGTMVNVSIPPNILTNFSSVLVEGVTSLTILSSGPDLPGGIEPVPATTPEYYDIVSSATYAGTIDISVVYDPGEVQGFEQDLLLFHYDQSTTPAIWRDVTTVVDTVGNVITGSVTNLSTFIVVEPGSPTGTQDPSAPTVFHLYRNFPNPFKSSTRIQFDLPAPGRVKVQIFDIQGRVVRSLLDAVQPVGRYSLFWPGDNDKGQKVVPGVYFYRIQTPANTATQKLIKVP